MNLFPLTDRPIASIAFHAEGELLAVASGHKVFNITFAITQCFLFFPLAMLEDCVVLNL